MTDLPQHLAVMSILNNLGDPAFAFDAYYEAAPDRTLYCFSYGIVLALAKIVPLEIAMRIVVFLSVIAYPLGVLAVLRATGRSGALALLTLPLMYSRTFFWGFVNFDLALGMALIAVALLERGARSVRSEIALAVLCIAIVLTHIYGVAIVLGYACLWAVVGDRRALLKRLPALSPLALGALAWFQLGRGVEGRGGSRFLSLTKRVLNFENSVIGGYPDWSDEVLLAAMLGAIVFFAARAFPWNRARWRTLGRCERIFVLYGGLNLALYFALPTHRPSGQFIHFRHALLAVAFLPLIAQVPGGQRPQGRNRTARDPHGTDLRDPLVAPDSFRPRGAQLRRRDRTAARHPQGLLPQLGQARDRHQDICVPPLPRLHSGSARWRDLVQFSGAVLEHPGACT